MSNAEPTLSPHQLALLAAFANSLAVLGPWVRQACGSYGCPRPAVLVFDAPRQQLCTAHAREWMRRVDRTYVAPDEAARP